MPAADAESDKQQLKAAVRCIILVQGNEFIKELMRKHKIHIGTKKANFSKDRFLRRHFTALDGDPKLFQPKLSEWEPVRGLVRVTGVLLMAGLVFIVLTLTSWAWLAVVERFL